MLRDVGVNLRIGGLDARCQLLLCILANKGSRLLKHHLKLELAILINARLNSFTLGNQHARPLLLEALALRGRHRAAHQTEGGCILYKLLELLLSSWLLEKCINLRLRDDIERRCSRLRV